MRLVIAAALALAAAPAAAQPLASSPLGPGEVLLEIDARGRFVTRVEVARVTVPVTGRGATAAAARADNAAKAKRLVAAARSAGIAAADVSEAPQFLPPGFSGAEVPDQHMRVGFIAEPGMEGKLTPVDQTSIDIRLRNPALFERLRDALEAAGAASVGDPVYVSMESAASRAAAKADAVRNARAEAEAYARATGMRVGRLLRISERAVSDGARMRSMTDFARMFYGEASSTTPEVETTALIAADFILVPER